MKTKEVDTPLSLSALLSRVLLAFALEFEAETDISLAIAANVLRVIGEDGVALRDLPRLSGVSKESIQAAVGYVKKRGLATERAMQKSRGKRIELTAPGRMARETYYDLTRAIEARWRDRLGKRNVEGLRVVLEELVIESGPKSPLLAAVQSYPEGWRAARPVPLTLPHYPMVLHRGGFPDGS